MFSDDLHEAGRIPRTIDCELTCDLGMIKHMQDLV